MKVVIQLKPEIVRQQTLLQVFQNDVKNIGGGVINIAGAIAYVEIPQHLMSSLKSIPGVKEILGVDLSKEVQKVEKEGVTVKKKQTSKLKFLGFGGGIILLAFFFYWLGRKHRA